MASVDAEVPPDGGCIMALIVVEPASVTSSVSGRMRERARDEVIDKIVDRRASPTIVQSGVM